MSFDWWTFALQTINFAVLVWLLHRFLYKPVLKAIDARRTEIESGYAEAEEAKREAEARLAEIEASRAGIAEERGTVLKRAATEAAEAAEARRAQAEREADALVEEGRKTIARERQEALSVLRHTALDFGANVARRLLEDIPAGYRTEAWLDRISEAIAGLEEREREEIAAGLRDGKPLRVVTAAALPRQAADKWRSRLQAAFGDTTDVIFDIDPALIAGVELFAPDAILRLSWRSELAAMRAEIESHADTQ